MCMEIGCPRPSVCDTNVHFSRTRMCGRFNIKALRRSGMMKIVLLHRVSFKRRTLCFFQVSKG